MPRPRRNATERIEDAFADLSVPQQATVLKDLEKLHRWCQRERSRVDRMVEDEEKPGGEPKQIRLTETA